SGASLRRHRPQRARDHSGLHQLLDLNGSGAVHDKRGPSPRENRESDELDARGSAPTATESIVTSGNPSRKNLYVVRVEGHQVGAISGGKLAEHVLETKKGRGMRRRKSQRVRQWNSEQANAIPDGGRHVENGPGERPVVRDAATVPRSDVFSVQAEIGAASAHGRHRI